MLVGDREKSCEIFCKKVESRSGGIRTHTVIHRRILSPLRLPFRHRPVFSSSACVKSYILWQVKRFGSYQNCTFAKSAASHISGILLLSHDFGYWSKEFPNLQLLKSIGE